MLCPSRLMSPATLDAAAIASIIRTAFRARSPYLYGQITGVKIAHHRQAIAKEAQNQQLLIVVLVINEAIIVRHED